VFLEVECVVCVLLDHLEDLDCLCNDLEFLRELAALYTCKCGVLPQGRRRHLHAISRLSKLQVNQTYQQEQRYCEKALLEYRLLFEVLRSLQTSIRTIAKLPHDI
jgi:hypothetical protein